MKNEIRLLNPFTQEFKIVTIDEVKAFVGVGWSSIIDSLIKDLFTLGWNGELHQVKEKFGGLRFYIGPGSHDIFERIDVAETYSYITCEVCGNLGVPRDSGWIKTLCDEHAIKYKPYELTLFITKTSELNIGPKKEITNFYIRK